MDLTFPQWAFLVGFVAYVAIRAVYKERTKKNQVVTRTAQTLETALLVLVALGTLVLPLVFLFSSWLGFADYPLPPTGTIAGVILLPLSLYLFWRSHHDLGRNWSQTLEIRNNHELVTHGVYRRVRHPMYTAILLFSLAQALLLENWLAGPSAFLTFSLLLLFRLPREESLLLSAFGPAYSTYSLTTGRLLPRWPRS